MIVGAPKLAITDNVAEVSAEITGGDGPARLWYRVDAAYADMISTRSDAFLLGLLTPAMMRGEALEVQGAVAPELYYAAARPLQHLAKEFIPELNFIEISAPTLKSAERSGSAVITGLSCGIDSFSAIADHWSESAVADYRLTHLLFNNVGGSREGGKRLFDRRVKNARAGAAALGLPLIIVDSNLEDFYGNQTFGATHTLRNLTVGLLLQKGAAKFLYASSQHYREKEIRPHIEISRADEIIFSLVSTPALQAVSVGSEYTRGEKTLQVAELEESWKLLDVCVFPFGEYPARNCSQCYKCVRTLLTLEAAGVSERYKECFTMPAYERARLKHIVRYELRGDKYWTEIKTLAKARGHKFPGPIRRAVQMLKLPGLKALINYVWRSKRVMAGLPPKPFT